MSDVFRKEYKTMSQENSDLIRSIKVSAEMVFKLMDHINNREMSIAKTNLEQAIMWATKAVVLEAEK